MRRQAGRAGLAVPASVCPLPTALSRGSQSRGAPIGLLAMGQLGEGPGPAGCQGQSPFVCLTWGSWAWPVLSPRPCLGSAPPLPPHSLWDPGLLSTQSAAGSLGGVPACWAASVSPPVTWEQRGPRLPGD